MYFGSKIDMDILLPYCTNFHLLIKVAHILWKTKTMENIKTFIR